MDQQNHAEALHLIDRAVLLMRGRHHPGRPAFYTLDRRHQEVQWTRREVTAPEGVDLETSLRAKGLQRADPDRRTLDRASQFLAGV